MSVTVPSRVPARTTYGWSGDGKTAAEISRDIRQTRYRLDADVRALRAKFAPRRFMPVVAVMGGLAALSVLIRFMRCRKR